MHHGGASHLASVPRLRAEAAVRAGALPESRIQPSGAVTPRARARAAFKRRSALQHRPNECSTDTGAEDDASLASRACPWRVWAASFVARPPGACAAIAATERRFTDPPSPLEEMIQ